MTKRGNLSLDSEMSTEHACLQSQRYLGFQVMEAAPWGLGGRTWSSEHCLDTLR
jgi:hypothetical protein